MLISLLTVITSHLSDVQIEASQNINVDLRVNFVKWLLFKYEANIGELIDPDWEFEQFKNKTTPQKAKFRVKDKSLIVAKNGEFIDVTPSDEAEILSAPKALEDEVFKILIKFKKKNYWVNPHDLFY